MTSKIVEAHAPTCKTKEIPIGVPLQAPWVLDSDKYNKLQHMADVVVGL